MKKVAIIGGGIVGASTAYFLKDQNIRVTVFDTGLGQATKAAVGIICPWVNQRRNQAWYHLVSRGARMYAERDHLFPGQSFYRETGTLITHDTQLEKLFELGKKRLVDHPEMKEVKWIDNVHNSFEVFQQTDPAIFVAGGGVVDGQLMVDYLLQFTDLVDEWVDGIDRVEGGFIVNGILFDQVVLATGAYLPQLLPEYDVDIAPQKGQLIGYRHLLSAKDYPVLMPTGFGDVMIDNQGHVIVGATHENDRDYDLKIETERLEDLIDLGKKSLDELKNKDYDFVKVGIRAYTKDFLPFYGQLEPDLFVASGLGSSGLTSGPFIGSCLAQMVLGIGDVKDYELYSPLNYIKSKV